jgi:hypothetical protein
MDPATISAVLLAIVGGAGGALGGQLWAGMSALVRRPFHHHATTDGVAPVAPLPSGEKELKALERAPSDDGRAAALAEVLVQRAGADSSFRQALEGWWEQSAPIRTGAGNVSNTISGGSQYGPVIQGRDFTGLTLNTVPPPVPPAPDQGA